MINLSPALAHAQASFAAADPVVMAVSSLCSYDEKEQKFIVPYLGRQYRVFYPEGKVEGPDGRDVPLPLQIVFLHYLTHAKPRQLEGKWISFKELPGGDIYIVPFTNRAIRPLVAIFGSNPARLVAAAERLGGRPLPLGTAAAVLPVLPKVPMAFVLWAGDEEFPPSGNILFDATAGLHLDTEDYALLPGLVLSELKQVTVAG